MLPKSDVIAFDIESIDYDGNYTDYPTQIACAGDNWCYVSRDNEKSVRHMIEDLIQAHNNGATLVGHYSWQFDVPQIRKFGYPEFPLGEDTMVLAYLEDETQPKGLESLCVKNLNIKGWKDEFEHPLGSEGFALYNARDVVYTLRLYRRLVDILGDRSRLSGLILKPAFNALASMSERGIYIDRKAVERERINAERVLSASLARIRALTENKDFNPGSTKQVGEYLISLGVVLPNTKSGKPGTSVKVLQELKLPITEAILEYRGAKKTIGTYVENYQKIIDADGRVHPEYKITRTLTGRSSAVNQNIQNLPREYKDFFGAEPGHVFCEVDWSAIEFRVAGWVAQESVILNNFSKDPEWDPHHYFAIRFYGDASIQTANMLALQGGIPTDGTGAEILCSLLPHIRKGEKATEILSFLYRSSWGRKWELSPQSKEGIESLLERGRSLLSYLTREQLRELWSYGETTRGQGREIRVELNSSSYRREPEKQRGFELNDSLQIMSSAPPFVFHAFEPEWDERRQIAKSCNFGLIYLGTGFTLVDYAKKMDLDISLRFADQLYRQWHSTFPGMRKLYKDTKDEILKTSEARTATGFIRHFGDITIMPQHLRSEALRQGVNVKVQGFSAHIAYIAMARLHELGMPLTGFIHDAFLFEFETEAECKEKLPVIENVMNTYPRVFLNEHFGLNFDIPLTTEAKYRVGT